MCGPGRRIPASGPNPVTTSRPGRRTRAGAESFFQEPIPRTRPRPPPLPARFGHIARPGDRGSRGPFPPPAAAPLRIYPARSAGPGFRVSPSVRIPGNCACVRPPHRMPPPTRTANRIIGRTRLSGCCPPRQPPVHTTSRPVLIPSGHCPCRLLSLPPTHTAPGPDPAPVRPILPIPFAPFSLYSASFSRLLLRAFPFPKIFSIGNLFYRKINTTFVPLSLTNNDENA